MRSREGIDETDIENTFRVRIQPETSRIEKPKKRVFLGGDLREWFRVYAVFAALHVIFSLAAGFISWPTFALDTVLIVLVVTKTFFRFKHVQLSKWVAVSFSFSSLKNSLLAYYSTFFGYEQDGNVGLFIVLRHSIWTLLYCILVYTINQALKAANEENRRANA